MIWRLAGWFGLLGNLTLFAVSGWWLNAAMIALACLGLIGMEVPL